MTAILANLLEILACLPEGATHVLLSFSLLLLQLSPWLLGLISILGLAR